MFWDWDYGDVPAWVGAIGTTGALAAAIWSVWDSANKNRAERERIQEERKEARIERERNDRAQALLIHSSLGTASKWFTVEIQNHSTAAIFNLSIIGIRDSASDIKYSTPSQSDRDRRGNTAFLPLEWDVLQPGEKVVTRIIAQQFDSEKRSISPPLSLTDYDLSMMAAEIQFLDSNGIFWTRSGMSIPMLSAAFWPGLVHANLDLRQIKSRP